MPQVAVFFQRGHKKTLGGRVRKLLCMPPRHSEFLGSKVLVDFLSLCHHHSRPFLHASYSQLQRKPRRLWTLMRLDVKLISVGTQHFGVLMMLYTWHPLQQLPPFFRLLPLIPRDKLAHERKVSVWEAIHFSWEWDHSDAPSVLTSLSWCQCSLDVRFPGPPSFPKKAFWAHFPSVNWSVWIQQSLPVSPSTPPPETAFFTNSLKKMVYLNVTDQHGGKGVSSFITDTNFPKLVKSKWSRRLPITQDT